MKHLPCAIVALAVVFGAALEWDFSARLWGVPASADVATLRERLERKDINGYDVAHYIDYSITGWQAAFWPPGQAIVARAVPGAGYIRWMQCLAGLAWLAVLLALVRVHGWRAVPLGVLPLFPISRMWMFGPGATGSESLAGALFVASLGFRRYEWCFLAAAAYFRAEYELYGLVTLGVLAARYKTRESVIALAAFYALTVPWKLHLLHRFGHYGMSLSLHHAAETEYWTATPPGYGYGGNAPCIADPETCAKITAVSDRVPTGEKVRLARRAFLLHPFAWLSYKLRFIGHFFFETFSAAEWLELLALLASGAFLSRMRLRAGAFLGATAVVYVFVHFETRYSLPLRLFLAAAPLHRRPHAG